MAGPPSKRLGGHMSHRQMAAALGLATALTASACSVQINGNDAIVREERRFTVSGEPDLQVETFDGSVQVRSWDGADVRVQIEKHGRDQQEAAALPIKIEQQGNRIRVQAEEPPGGSSNIPFGGGRSVSLIISVPRAARV